MMLAQDTDSMNRLRSVQAIFQHCGRVSHERSLNRHGSVLVISLLLMIAMLAVLAFAVDLGYVMHVKTELQRTADACALAAAGRLPDVAAATAVAQSTAVQNNWSSEVKIGEGDEWHGSDIDPMDVEIGRWNRDTATFTTPVPAGYSPNAVRVILRRTKATGNPLTLFFGRVLGKSNTDTSASATAIYDRWLCGPFVGIDWISVPGSPQTDSYNSDEGPYGTKAPGHRGSICSDGPIGVDGAGIVRGDARAGKGHAVTITGGATVTRSIGSRSKPLNMPPVDVSEVALANDNAQVPLLQNGNSWISPVDADGNFLLDGNKVIDMPPGTYYFNDFILAGQAQFHVSGPTTIYVTGTLERAGGAIVTNPTKKPANMKFLMTGGTANVTSENDFYGLIYAPNTAVTVDGSADYFGAVVGKTITLSGSGAAHYDESMNLDYIEFPRRTALVD
jgi:hypothetical protein